MYQTKIKKNLKKIVQEIFQQWQIVGWLAERW